MMVRTQILQLYRQRMLFWLVGVVIVVILPSLGIALTEIFTDSEFGAASVSVILVGGFGWMAMLLAGMLFGATAGSKDYSSGVIRDYVLTGVDRWKIHTSQFLAALVVVLGLLVASGALATATIAVFDVSLLESFAKATGNDSSIGDLVRGVIVVFLPVTLLVLTCHGVGSFVRSRGIAIGVLAGYFMIADRILGAVVDESVTFIGSVSSTFQAFLDPNSQEPLPYGSLVACVAWIALIIGAPLWRLYRKDL